VKVTHDAALDWAPAWSPDGKFLYFASDRGGAMGLWRVAVDQASGRPRGSPVPIATGVDVDMDLPHLSRDGQTLLFRSKIESVNPAALSLDPITGRAGAVTRLQPRSGILVPTDVSPDGKWLALVNIPDRQQDLFLMRPDGSGLTRLTDDVARDWSPRFTPDGKALVFFSNQSGKYDAWSVQLDGSARTRLTDFTPGVTFSMFAPDAERLAVGLESGGVIGTAPWPLKQAAATELKLDVSGGTIVPTYWSRDGRWLSGYVVNQHGEGIGFGVYDVATGLARRLNDDSRGYDLAWLPGGREVIYFTARGGLVRQDVLSLERREVAASLPYPPDILWSLALAPDGRTLYYGARQIEANIWVVQRSRAPSP
jgi:Tol biopolymer transport system component